MTITVFPPCSLFLRTITCSSFTGVTSQDRPNYAVVTNNSKISGALRNKGLFLVLKEKNNILIVKENVIHDTLKNGKTDLMQERLL